MASEETVRCAECSTELAEAADRRITDGGTFCGSCFERLTHEVRQAIEAQGHDVNYPMAAFGGAAGAALGIGVWWGFTVVTNIAFGLVAVVIGFAVGKGVVMLSGQKRHPNLQIMSVAIATLGFAYASYLVNRTFFMRAFVEQGQAIVLPFLPPPQTFYTVVSAGFGIMDLVFLGIVIYEAWRIPAPLQAA